MRTLVLYASRHGSTEKATQALAAALSGEVTVVDLNKSPVPELSAFTSVVIGSAVYVGKILAPVTKYLDENKDILADKQLGFFICCANVERAPEQLKANFPAHLLAAAKATGHFGYAIQMDRMNFFERTAIRVIMKTSDSSEHILTDNIAEFAKAMTSQ